MGERGSPTLSANGIRTPLCTNASNSPAMYVGIMHIYPCFLILENYGMIAGPRSTHAFAVTVGSLLESLLAFIFICNVDMGL